MQPELELGDDAEVAASAAKAPEEVGILVGARAHELAVRRAGAACDQRRTAVDRTVPDLAVDVVARFFRSDQLTAKRAFELLQRAFVQCQRWIMRDGHRVPPEASCRPRDCRAWEPPFPP